MSDVGDLGDIAEEKYRQADSTGEIAMALAKAQGEMGKAVKDEVNPHFKSKYSSLTSVIDAVRQPLSRNGIAWVQKSIYSERGIMVETVFYHSSGQTISTGPIPVPVDKANAHGVGSALTYAKRYSLAMACGIGTDDDDGNAAVAAPPAAPEVSTADPAIVADLESAADEGKDKFKAEWDALPTSTKNAVGHRMFNMLKEWAVKANG